MTTVQIREFEESFVIHFGSDFERINAYTLASTLVAFADAAKSANAAVNPGFEIEVVVEALGPGSFKAQVRALYRSASNLFTHETAKTIVLGVIAAFVYEQTLAPDKNVKVVVNTDEVVIEQGDKKIIVPRQVHQALESAKKSNEFRGNIGRAFDALERDPQISSLGLSPRLDDPKPPLEVPRERFPLISSTQLLSIEDSREIVEHTELQIMRAILERSRRRWEFVWRGVRIAAPVTDDRFFGEFAAHRITIAPGDGLEVRLRIRQRKDSASGIFLNDPNGYEVVEVLKHLPRHTQTSLPDIDRENDTDNP